MCSSPFLKCPGGRGTVSHLKGFDSKLNGNQYHLTPHVIMVEFCKPLCVVAETTHNFARDFARVRVHHVQIVRALNIQVRTIDWVGKCETSTIPILAKKMCTFPCAKLACGWVTRSVWERFCSQVLAHKTLSTFHTQCDLVQSSTATNSTSRSVRWNETNPNQAWFTKWGFIRIKLREPLYAGTGKLKSQEIIQNQNAKPKKSRAYALSQN